VRLRPPRLGYARVHEYTLVEHDVLARTLGSMARGAEFASLVEDRRFFGHVGPTTSRELSSGHESRAGIRVLVGDTTGLPTPRISRRWPQSGGVEGGAVARGGGGGVREIALGALATIPVTRRYFRRRRQARKIE